MNFKSTSANYCEQSKPDTTEQTWETRVAKPLRRGKLTETQSDVPTCILHKRRAVVENRRQIHDDNMHTHETHGHDDANKVKHDAKSGSGRGEDRNNNDENMTSSSSKKREVLLLEAGPENKNQV